MKYNLKTFKNGLRLVTVPLPVKSVTEEVGVDAGSRYETEENSGISHFAEHMFFKGTKKRPTAQDLATEVDGFGGAMNAGTGKEETNFHIKAAAKHLPQVLEILGDILFNSKFEQKEIKKEKGVIVEEINMRNDIPMSKVGEIYDSLLYGKTPLGRDIIGKKETVTALQRKDFLAYWRRCYRPEKMVVSIAGGIGEIRKTRYARRDTQDEIGNLIEKYFSFPSSCHSEGADATEESPADSRRGSFGFDSGSTSSPFAQPQDDGRQIYSFSQSKPQVKIHYKKTEQAHFCLGVRAFKRGHPDRYILAVLATILGGSMSSRLFEELREKRGLAYYIRTEVEGFQETGHLLTQAGVDVRKLEEAAKVILAEYRQISNFQFPISNEELKKAKEFLKGHLILSLEDSHDVASLFGSALLLEGKVRPPEEIMAGIDKVTTVDLQRVAQKIFLQKGLNLAIIGPYKEKRRFEKILNY